VTNKKLWKVRQFYDTSLVNELTVAVRTHDTVVVPFVMAAETKNAKLAAVAVGGLHKMAARGVIEQVDIPAFIVD